MELTFPLSILLILLSSFSSCSPLSLLALLYPCNMAKRILKAFKTCITDHYLLKKQWRITSTFTDVWHHSNETAAKNLADVMKGTLDYDHKGRIEITTKEGIYTVANNDNTLEAEFMEIKKDEHGNEEIGDVSKLSQHFGAVTVQIHTKYGEKDKTQKEVLEKLIRDCKAIKKRNRYQERDLQMYESMLSAADRRGETEKNGGAGSSGGSGGGSGDISDDYDW